MTTNMTRLLLATFLVFGIANANAASTYGVRGCGKLISAIDTNSEKDKFYKDATRMVVQGWIAGYVSSHNSWLEIVTQKKDIDIIGTTDIDGVWQSVLNYCRANPLQNVYDAMQVIIDGLEEQRKKRNVN